MHCQVAEGNNSLIKKSFSAYGWFRPEYSQMYLNEFSFFKSVKYYGWENIISVKEKLVEQNTESTRASASLREPEATRSHSLPYRDFGPNFVGNVCGGCLLWHLRNQSSQHTVMRRDRLLVELIHPLDLNHRNHLRNHIDIRGL